MNEKVKMALEKLSQWVNTNKKVSMITYRTFKKLVKDNRYLTVRDKLLAVASEEELRVLCEVLLAYEKQNPDSELTKRMLEAPVYHEIKKMIHDRKSLTINDNMLLPVKEEEFQVIGEILLYISQNPDSKLTSELFAISGFDEMLDNIIKN